MAARAAALCGAAAAAAGHGSLIAPIPRNAGDRVLPAWRGGRFGNVTSCAHVAAPTQTCWGCDCVNGTHACEAAQTCAWFSQGCSIGCAACDGEEGNPNFRDRCGSGKRPTNNDRRFRTYNRDAPAMSPADRYQHNPWRAPGNAPVFDACGMAGGSPAWVSTALSYIDTPFAKQGDRGSVVLPRAPTGVVWAAGATVEAKWSVRANHGGGYQYRLCPAASPLTEECFQRTPIPFARRMWLEFRNGTRAEIQGTYLSEGTQPAGSTWAVNPLPYCKNKADPVPGTYNVCHEDTLPFPSPCEGMDDRRNATDPRPQPLCYGQFPWGVTIVDALTVPRDTPPGEYVVGLRYDCETSAQIWSSCADIAVA